MLDETALSAKNTECEKNESNFTTLEIKLAGIRKIDNDERI